MKDPKTTISGIATAVIGLLTALAALPYHMGDVANVLPPEWKTRLTLIGAVSTALLFCINSVFQKDAPKNPPRPGGLPLLLLPVLFLTGCGTLFTASYPVGTDGKAFISSDGTHISVGYKGRLPMGPLRDGKSVVPPTTAAAPSASWLDSVTSWFK